MRIAGALAALFVAGCATQVKDTSHTFRTVVIDPGHGGRDSGTVSRRGMAEKNAVLDVAFRLDDKLRAAGFHTVMTRERDVFVPLNRRAEISNSQRNAIFVSIHFNDSPRRAVHGVETYYRSNVATGIADRIQQKLVTMPAVSNGGVRHANYRVLRLATYPAVLVECGYFSNRNEARRCAMDGYREEVANKITEALVEQRYGPNYHREEPTQIATAAATPAPLQ
ncbi:MAG: N-acetylmuramoyl-L-alanine amidase [Verrucomicrobiota bacterium]|nr:N-acetylmuramoyl-L-alanine amidase [Verrucomicrobiota bacterium]